MYDETVSRNLLPRKVIGSYLEVLGERLDRLDLFVGAATDFLLDQSELLLAEVGSVKVDVAQNFHIGRRWLRRIS